MVDRSQLAPTFVFLGVLSWASSLWAQSASAPSSPDVSEVRQAVERSLPYLMQKGFYWKNRTFTDRKIQCISCHHIPLAIWSHNLAKAKGFAIDQQQVDTLTDWMLDFSLDRKYPDELVDGFLDAALLASTSGPARPNTGEATQTFLQLLVEHQAPDGSWQRQDSDNEPGFEILPPTVHDQPAARREACDVDTLWVLHALAVLDRGPDAPLLRQSAALIRSRSAAFDFLQASPLGRRNDALACRLLLAQVPGGPSQTDNWAKLLLQRQNPDGGWGLLPEDRSHPVVTGQALYALSWAASGGDQSALGRACGYLTSQQRPNGSWPAASRATANHSNDITENFGTGWATLGLLATLPAPQRAE